MIFTNFFDTLYTVIKLALSGLSFVNIPIDLIKVIGTLASYGNWVIGSDLMLIFAGCIFFWTCTKFSVGLVLFIWDLLPFT